MMRSNPLVQQVGDFCHAHQLLPQGGTVLLALSGGRDSMVLADLLQKLSQAQGFSLAAAHFNHHLRPTAMRDEMFVRDWCAERHIPLTVGGGDVKTFAQQKKTSIEDAARTLRYDFLQQTALAQSAHRIATAHHQQDNAETVLLHLLRGAGLTGLCGIPPQRGNIIRPLLEVSREEINRYVAFHHLPYVEDETNQDTAMLRNRLRLELLPLLEELAPGAVGRIAQTAALLTSEERHWESAVAQLLPLPASTLPMSLFLAQDCAFQRRLVRHWLGQWNFVPSAEQTDRIVHLKTGGSLPLSREIWVHRQSTGFSVIALPPPSPPQPLHLGEQVWDSWRITVQYGAQDQNAIFLPPDTNPTSLSITYWDGTGRLSVENGCRTIKRLMADHRIPLSQQRRCPVLLQNGTPVGVWGISNHRLSAVDALVVLLQNNNTLQEDSEERTP